MRLIGTITDEDIFGKRTRAKILQERSASRAIMLKGEDIALLWLSKHSYHKLPGGGIEKGEDSRKALNRELLEETGWEAKVRGELGITIEIRARYGLRQVSYTYLADAIRKVSVPRFTPKEMSKGFELRWINIYDAYKIMQNETPKDYEGKFIHFRDFLLLKNALFG